MKLKKALTTLGYTQDWIDFRIITQDFIFYQYEVFLLAEDKNAEHYRNAGYAKYLSTKTKLSGKEIERIFQLQDKGPDNHNLKTGRIIGLIESGILTDDQLEGLKRYPEVIEGPSKKVYLRTILIRKIRQIGVHECFNEITKTTDSFVHKFVLKQSDLRREHVLLLSQNGGNIRVRNTAKQMMNRKKFSV